MAQRVRAIADEEPPGHVDARRRQLIGFFQQGDGVHHEAVADHSFLPRLQNAAWNEPDDELLVADDDGVAGVMAALVAHHVVELVREQINQLALAFIAPLRAENDDVAHVRFRSLWW